MYQGEFMTFCKDFDIKICNDFLTKNIKPFKFDIHANLEKNSYKDKN